MKTSERVSETDILQFECDNICRSGVRDKYSISRGIRCHGGLSSPTCSGARRLWPCAVEDSSPALLKPIGDVARSVRTVNSSLKPIQFKCNIVVINMGFIQRILAAEPMFALPLEDTFTWEARVRWGIHL